MKGEGSETVTAERTAKHIGSGDVQVYATPMMALFVERFCHNLVESELPQGQVTVGVTIHLEHLAPSPIGDEITIRAEVTSLEQNRVSFSATLWDSNEKVGVAEHTRAIIDVDRFVKRIEAKSSALGER
jgi:predicted thioesterase